MEKYLLFLIFVFFISGASAHYIYGDIYIKDNGMAEFVVNTDTDIGLEGIFFDGDSLKGKSNELVSMDKGVWTFILDLGYYETILLDIHLPEKIEKINSIEGVEYLIGFNQKTISLIDHDKELYFQINYELDYLGNNKFIYFILGVLFFVVFSYIFINLSKRKEKRLQSIFPLINDNEKKIIEILMKKPLRQKDVRKILKIPKSSYSRYLVNLEKKKLIIREGDGKNKILRLK